MTYITKEKLIEAGWLTINDPVVWMEKKIENRNPINKTPEDTDIRLILHGYYNHQTFAIAFPNGAMLNFVANSMEEIEDFEKRILFYDCEY